MLCSNDSKTLRSSLDSVLELSKFHSVEIVVVDNLSEDGSREILREYAREGRVILLEQRCSRGRGRQLAVERASGSYILAHMDCDDVFSAEGLEEWLRMYHQRFDGMMLMTKKTNTDERSNITVAPRELLLKLGWRDLNWFEDWDLWNRAISIDKYAFIGYPNQHPLHKSITVRVARRRGMVSRNVMTFGRYRDSYRIGKTIFRSDRAVSMGQKLIYYSAVLATIITRSRLPHVEFPNFDSNSDPREQGIGL